MHINITTVLFLSDNLLLNLEDIYLILSILRIFNIQLTFDYINTYISATLFLLSTFLRKINGFTPTHLLFPEKNFYNRVSTILSIAH